LEFENEEKKVKNFSDGSDCSGKDYPLQESVLRYIAEGGSKKGEGTLGGLRFAIQETPSGVPES